jgi:hypothetical protein
MTDQNYQAWLAYLDAIRASLVHAADKPVFDTTGYGQRTHGGLNGRDVAFTARSATAVINDSPRINNLLPGSQLK